MRYNVTTIMTTIRTVGIRELKRDAPRLVEAAREGAQIVVTRYGRPQAVLTSVADSRAERGGRHAEWEQEHQAYERALPRLSRRYPGQWVAIHHGKVVGHHRDYETLYRRVSARLPRSAFFVGRPDQAPALVDMPGFEVE
jgi:prevent-host-death family protein